jgi:hypothetical protein
MVPRDFPTDVEGPCSLLPHSDYPLRELQHPEGAHAIHGVRFARVACACGWRSPYLRVPLVQWWPYMLDLDAQRHDRAWDLWLDEHERRPLVDADLLSRWQPPPPRRPVP